MAERTEAEMLARSPIKAQLGDATYEIPIPTILRAREWRVLLFQEASVAVNSLSTNIVNLATLVSGLGDCAASISGESRRFDLRFRSGITSRKDHSFSYRRGAGRGLRGDHAGCVPFWADAEAPAIGYADGNGNVSIAEIYELALFDWGVHPDQLNLWTEELLALMFRSRNRRMQRIRDAQQKDGEPTRVSDLELFKSVGITPKVIHRVN
jgi:hypothetical protein